MCKLYRMMSNIEVLRRLFAATDEITNLPLFPEIRSTSEAPIIRADRDGRRRIELACWSIFGPPDIRRPITSIRNLESSYWRDALIDPTCRCLIPATEFSEWSLQRDPQTRRRHRLWFQMRSQEPFVFAGIVFGTESGELDRFAFLVCAPNAVVGNVQQNTMPVILHGDAEDAWLEGKPAEQLAMPLPDELMHLASTET